MDSTDKSEAIKIFDSMENMEADDKDESDEKDESDDEILAVYKKRVTKEKKPLEEYKKDESHEKEDSDDEILAVYKERLINEKKTQEVKKNSKRVECATKKINEENPQEEKKDSEGEECTKRKRLEENSVTEGVAEPACTCKRVKYPETIESLIDNIVESKRPLKAILSDDYYKPVPFTKVYVGQVKSVKELSKIILLLNEKLPLKNLSHLKRAYRKEVILFPINYLNSQTHASIQYYIEENINELRDSFEYFKIADVPAEAPKLRKQYSECARSWSCNFHPDKYLEKLFADELFSEQEIERHRLFMSMAFEVAVYYMRKERPVVGPYDVMSADSNAAIVVDSSNQSVVAVAFDNRAENPIQHSAMLAIDNVAKTQNGGAWNTYDIDSINLRGIGYMELLLHLKHKYPNIKFGARNYVSKSDIDDNLAVLDSPYLCTGYYIYMIREPCMMCAMGLVHARSKRVFFCIKNSVGALTSLTKLHCLPSLNHHFEVFTDFL